MGSEECLTMLMPESIPRGWKQVEIGEIRQEGDLFWGGKYWHTSTLVGCEVTDRTFVIRKIEGAVHWPIENLDGTKGHSFPQAGKSAPIRIELPVKSVKTRVQEYLNKIKK